MESGPPAKRLTCDAHVRCAGPLSEVARPSWDSKGQRDPKGKEQRSRVRDFSGSTGDEKPEVDLWSFPFSSVDAQIASNWPVSTELIQHGTLVAQGATSFKQESWSHMFRLLVGSGTIVANEVLGPLPIDRSHSNFLKGHLHNTLESLSARKTHLGCPQIPHKRFNLQWGIHGNPPTKPSKSQLKASKEPDASLGTKTTPPPPPQLHPQRGAP